MLENHTKLACLLASRCDSPHHSFCPRHPTCTTCDKPCKHCSIQTSTSQLQVMCED